MILVYLLLLLRDNETVFLNQENYNYNDYIFKFNFPIHRLVLITG